MRVRGRDAVPDPVGEDEDIADIAPPPDREPRTLSVPARLSGQRLDKVLAETLPGISRSRIQQWIVEGAVKLNGAVPRPRNIVVAGDAIVLVPPPTQDSMHAPEPRVLDRVQLVFEDKTLVVLDKPPGLVVHPAAGHASGTLLNGLLAYDARQAALPRAGIVHRLDAGTSGLMVVARTEQAQADLARQLQARSVTREYWAIAYGALAAAGTVDASIARDPRNPLRFKVSRAERARQARTSFRLIQTVDLEPQRLSWVALRLHTGRTHQIRLHMEYLGHPLVGDPIYRQGRPQQNARIKACAVDRFARQALHACRLTLTHPVSGKELSWFRAPPADMRDLMKLIGLSNVHRWRSVF